jgi:hypothetical protein
VQLRDGQIYPDRIRERIRPRARRPRGSSASISTRTAMYRYDEFDAAFVRERTAQFSDQVRRAGSSGELTRTSSGRCG